MDILVFIKQVVSDQEPGLLEEGYTLDRSRASLDINPTDCAALEHALSIKEEWGAA